MKKFGLLLTAIVVSFSLFAACADNETVPADGEAGYGDDAASDNDSDSYLYVADDNGDNVLDMLGNAFAAANAMSNFGDELAQRITTTPFQSLVYLVDALEHGTTTVNFAYIDEWREWDDSIFVNASFLSDMDNLNFALRGDVTLEGINVDFSTFFNEERLAIGSSWFGGEYFGVVFDTLLDDVLDLIEEFGLDISEFEGILMELMELMEYLDLLYYVEYHSGLEDEFMELLVDFILGAEQTLEDIDGVRRVAYTLTLSDLIDFTRAVYLDLFLANDAIMSVYDIPFMGDLGASSAAMEDAILEVMAMLDYAEQLASGSLTTALYIGAGDRLNKIDIYGVLEVEGEEFDFSLVFDFGIGATDTWTITASASDGWDTYSATIEWAISTAGSNVHEISLSDNGFTMGSVISDWNPVSGEFVFGANVAGERVDFFGGNLTTSGGTFNMAFEHIDIGDDWREGFSLAISTARSANIGNVNFINIAQLTAADIEAIIENVMAVMMGFDEF